jgi:hypothetical protein
MAAVPLSPGNRKQMKRIVFAAIAVTFSCPSQAAELPLKRVALSTSGLAQFTHSGQVAAGAPVELSVRLDQVDDLLKSLTIFDRQGAIGAVSLPGKAPLAELFRDLPFGPDALNSPSALLNAMVGAEIEIEGQVTARGRVFRVEQENTQLPNNGGQVVRHRITILSDKGLVQAVLEELTALRFTDPLAKAQIDRALSGLALNRAKERRILSIGFLGQGAREAGFSYVVAAPVWKTAYRLVLPKDDAKRDDVTKDGVKDGAKARLQGWAVIENLSGGDWRDVDLTLVSGNPVALKQSLYTPFFSDRPEAPVTVSSRVMPRKDDAEGGLDDRINRALAQAAPPRPAPQMATAAPGAGRMASAARRGVGGGGSGKAIYDRLGASPDQEVEPAAEVPAAAAVAAEAEEASTQVLYRFPGKLTLAAGSTMMAPFVDHEIGAQRAWLYQPETNARHPLAAVRLKNDSESGLPAGLITAFDMGGDGSANFAGDAQLPLMPRGALKFVTFALDSKTDIRRTDQGVKATRLGKAVNGQLTVTVRSRWSIDYEVTPPQDEDREVFLEEARSDSWKVAGDGKDVEETPTRFRYKVLAARGKTTKASLTLERVEHETIALADMEPESILTTVNGLENEDAALKEAVGKLGEVVAQINKANTRREELETERKKINDDQGRVRQNLTSVGSSSDLGRRYLDTLKKQEDRLAAIEEADKGVEKDIAARRAAAEQLARDLKL